MSQNPQTTPPEPFGTFEEIEAAVRETERGRWFLDEYKRRCQPESRELIASLRRIERAIHTGPGSAAHTIASLAEKLRGLRSVMPFLAEVSARTAAETAKVSETLSGLAGMDDKALIAPEKRETLKEETGKLQLLATEQRAVAENIARCNATLATVDEGLSEMATPGLAEADMASRPVSGERARIVMLRGNAEPPLPENEAPEAQRESTRA